MPAKTILVVDDERLIADVLCRLLEDEGYRARCVHDGQAALAEAEHQPPIWW